jgi:hypothetical protein
MPDLHSRSTRKLADIVAIVAAVTAIGNALWGPLIFSAMQESLPQGDPGVGYNWLAFGIGGIVALLGIFVAQKRPVPGRILLAIAGVMLVLVPLFYDRKHMLPITASVVLGLAMLASSFFLGPVPRSGGHLATEKPRLKVQ